MNSPMRRRPSPGSATARVWEIADELQRQSGRLPGGREVVDRYVAEGGKEGTGFTQFSHWKKEQVGMGGRSDEPRSASLTVDGQGRVTLPPEFLAEMALGAGRKVTAFLKDGEVRMLSPAVAVRKVQAFARTLPHSETSVVDEFLAEKRAEDERE
jgi:bifunctional DNA-binding transcriptional regulator/antitoxin component of YhaV-PrlF toxin-antitoxin module